MSKLLIGLVVGLLGERARDDLLGLFHVRDDSLAGLLDAGREAGERERRLLVAQ